MSERSYTEAELAAMRSAVSRLARTQAFHEAVRIVMHEAKMAEAHGLVDAFSVVKALEKEIGQ